MVPWGSNWTIPEGWPFCRTINAVSFSRVVSWGQKSSRNITTNGLGLDPGLDKPVVKETFRGACCVLGLVVQSCQTLCDCMDCSPSVSSVHGDSPGKNTGVGFHTFLQEIFPTQGLNSGLLHCKWIFYRLSHLGSLLYSIQLIKISISVEIFSKRKIC